MVSENDVNCRLECVMKTFSGGRNILTGAGRAVYGDRLSIGLSNAN